MIEELKDTKLIEKVGGRFKLTALIQKRVTELMEGAVNQIPDGMVKAEPWRVYFWE